MGRSGLRDSDRPPVFEHTGLVGASARGLPEDIRLGLPRELAKALLKGFVWNLIDYTYQFDFCVDAIGRIVDSLTCVEPLGFEEEWHKAEPNRQDVEV